MKIAIDALYSAHVAELQRRTGQVLARENLDALVIHAGKELKVFLDDTSYPFKVNPHFKHWLPLTDISNCWLIVNGHDLPKLIYFQPEDFWHQVIELPDDFWRQYFTVEIIKKASDIDKILPYDKLRLAYIGEHIEVARALGFDNINPEPVLNYLHYHRGYKTFYEHECLRRANAIAAKGHRVAEQAFIAGQSEFQIQQAYLQTIEHNEHQTPYDSIVALNEHAAILHYTGADRQPAKLSRSLLIDAGARYQGYCADITRTYAKQGSHFSDLIKRVDEITLKLNEILKPGISYIDVHLAAYREIAITLKDFGIITTSVEAAIAAGVVSTFFPHGIGHHLGLQTHDVGALMLNERGSQINPPEQHPFLRATRKVEVNQVFTIEPGIYFIPALLSQLKNSEYVQMVNWQIVEQLSFYGGIRIEDNIIVHQSFNENITRVNKI
ncbi:MAG: Xaa-Pro dipeptidase [Thalassotalea sp.]